MNIKQFLLDNYIWILVIILITIVTIIGFLADKKKNNNKNGNSNNAKLKGNMNNNQMMNNAQILQNQQQPMQTNQFEQSAPMPMNQFEQPTSMQMNQFQTPVNTNLNNNNGINFNNNMNTNIMPNNQINNIQSMVTEPQPINMVQTPLEVNNNNPQPIENIIPAVEPEPMYQPMSEQTPNFGSQPMPQFTPTEINNTDQNASNNVGLFTPNNGPINVINTPQQPNINVIPTQTLNQPENILPNSNLMNAQPTTNEPMPQMMPSYNSFQSTQNSNIVPTPNVIPTPNMNFNNTTVPQPVNPVPVPQPVIPTPIMQDSNGYSQPQMMPQSNIAQPNINNIPMQNNTMLGQQAGFVYGPQNNNQNM